MLLALSAASSPRVLTRATGGLWEIEGVPGAPRRQRICLADPGILAQLEHRREGCTRVIVRDGSSSAEVHYTCSGNGFGQTVITSLTPRSLRVETQGISGNAPFHYTFQARRVGNC